MAAPCRACGRPNSEDRAACVYCGELLSAPRKCGACGRDIPPAAPKCLYCGVEAGKTSAPPPPPPRPAAPAVEPATLPTPTAPEPMPEIRERAIGCSPKTVDIVFIVVPLLAAVWALYTFRSFRATWPIACTVAWFICAGRSFTNTTAVITRNSPGSRFYSISRFTQFRSFPVTVTVVALSAVAWLVVFIWAFKGSFGSAKWSFLGGFILFASSLLTRYQFKDTRAPVINQELEAHVQDFGMPVAFLRQYYIWGLLLPFAHACFRLMT